MKKTPTKRCCQCDKPRATHRVLVVGVGIRFMCRRCSNALGAKKT